ncbi:hypothetical protein CVT26_015135 [Gymnopilus dilepis]|uniref:Uncharacterized protein n=1 Tax=Gymnopilus dilepis TaxID=231916 RepID=A0A409WQY9_9AGAR|nr:hypothetical protein CVT26_015135 [Gymnopilus dilepis]
MCAIARVLFIYEVNNAEATKTASKGVKFNAGRGLPAVASAADSSEVVGPIHGDGKCTQTADNLDFLHSKTKFTAVSHLYYINFDTNTNTHSFVNGL